MNKNYFSLKFFLISLLAVFLFLSNIERWSGNFAYNLYQVALSDYLQKVSNENKTPIPSNLLNLLDWSASLQNYKAIEESEYLRQVLDPELTKVDPLMFWLGIQGWSGQQQNRFYPDSVWEFAHNNGHVRVEAEEMLVAGVPEPNQYVSYRSQDENIKYVALFWGLNSLELPFLILEDGTYLFTVRAKDWPPSPLKVRLRIQELSAVIKKEFQFQEYILEWDIGDRVWRDNSVKFFLPRGKYVLHITYMPPAGNRTQKSSIDYIEIYREK